MKLNIGCGTTKYPGFVNIDSETSLNPDVVHDLKGRALPYAEGEVDEIWFIHCIEHIEEQYHFPILLDFHRVLKPEGKLIIAYPEFIRCASAYMENRRGMRDFWKATIYGRQGYPGDYHVSLMDTRDFSKLLERVGFSDITYNSEPVPNEINTILSCVKGQKMLTKEDLLRKEIFG